MLHFYQILHFSFQPSEPRLGQIYVFTRNGLTPLRVQSPVSSIISQFSQQIESGISCFDQKMILHHARQSPLSLSAILNLFEHKNTGFNLSPLCVHWAGRWSTLGLPLLGEQSFEKLSSAAGHRHNFGVEKSSFSEFYDRLVSITLILR